MYWKLTILPEDAGLSAGEILQKRLRISRLLCKRIRLYGSITLDSQPHRMKDPCAEGQILIATYQDPQGECAEWIASTPLLPVLAQTEHWVLVNKPPRMVTHPTYLHQEHCLTQLLSDSLLRPVSRLDRDTSGIVLLAKSCYAHHSLAHTRMTKIYRSWVHGLHIPDSGEILASIRRASDSILLREIHPEGQHAHSLYRVLRRWNRAQVTEIEYQLLTGRTHQLRLHSLHAGWPIVGETLYGCGRFDPNWGLHRRYSIRPDAEERAELERCAWESSGKDMDLFSYLGPYRNSKERFGDLQTQKPAELDLKQALFWDQRMQRQALHAWKLEFIDPWTEEPICIEAPIPPDLQNLLTELDAWETTSGDSSSTAEVSDS